MGPRQDQGLTQPGRLHSRRMSSHTSTRVPSAHAQVTRNRSLALICQVRSCVSFVQKSLVKVMGQNSTSIFSQLTRFMNDYRSSPGTSNDARLLSNSTSCDLGVPLGCLFGSAGPSWGLLGTLEGLAFLLRFPKERASGTDAFGILMPKG